MVARFSLVSLKNRAPKIGITNFKQYGAWSGKGQSLNSESVSLHRRQHDGRWLALDARAIDEAGSTKQSRAPKQSAALL